MSTLTGEVVNRVAASPILTLNLEEMRDPRALVLLDISPQLFQGLILREKDFRQFVDEHDWTQYQGQHLAVFCTADAVIPTWAYMLVAVAAQPHAASVRFATPAEAETQIFLDQLAKINWASYQDKLIVLKGCGSVPIAAYVAASAALRPYARKLMFGEPCSQVPIYKAPKG
jgi:hypothetical protein